LIPILNLASLFFKGISLMILGLRALRKKSYPETVIISVDNLSFGGTGKTTMVREIGHILKREELKFAIISRGYRSEFEKSGIRVSLSNRVHEVGDEALLLKRHFPAEDVYIGKNRHESIKEALNNNCRIIILDDGFQSTGIHKNLKIMLINPHHPYYYLRNFKWLCRWEDLILTLARESECCSTSDKSPLTSLKKTDKQPLQGLYAFTPLVFFNPEGHNIDPETSSLLGFSALGDNPRFRSDLSGFNLKQFRPFPDHHAFTQADLVRLNTLRRENRIEYLICTEKDWVKLSELNISGIPLIYARNSIKFSFNLDDLILKHVKQ
jgi:tetraacyldisaccharide 4'-kinase